MSSIVGNILAYLETNIELAVTGLSKSKNYYDFEKNDSARNNYVYAVRPGSASRVPGTLRHVTLEQDFEIIISKDYIENGSTDLAIRSAVDTIYLDNEKILKEISLRKTADILKVSEPSYGAPEVNQNQKSVSITFTYPITYRKSIKGDL